MTVQRLSIGQFKGDVYANSSGLYMYYSTHEEVVSLMREQLNSTQKQLEQSQEQCRALTHTLCETVSSMRSQ